MRPPCLIYHSTSTVQGATKYYLITGLSVCVCVTFVVFTDCESCTRPISTNTGSTEAGVGERLGRTCFIARRLEVVAIAGLM